MPPTVLAPAPPRTPPRAPRAPSHPPAEPTRPTRLPPGPSWRAHIGVAEVVRVAFEALRMNLLRSVLTMLGIIIGVGAVITMLALGRGAQDAVNARIAALGTTLLTVVPGQVFTGGVASASDRARLTVDDATLLAERGTTFAAVEPEMSRQLQVQYGRANASTNVVGAPDNYPVVRRYTLAAGRMFGPNEDAGRKRVAVVGATTATNLGVVQPAALVGEQVRINGVAFEVVGVFAAKGGATGFNDPDDQIVIPLGTAQFRLLGTPYLRAINLLAPSEDRIDAAMAEAEKIMRRAHRIPVDRPNDFQLRTQADFLNTAAETTQVFTYLLAGVALVSLLVGGIGIMNIMLVSVTERTREIGLRKAVGATRTSILAQFLIEAIVLCVLGGLLGIAVGVGAAVVMHAALGWTTNVEPNAIVLSFAFSAGVGIVFGVWPARRAAHLDPIDALRHE